MSIQIIPTEPGSLCRETIIQSNAAVGNISLGVIDGPLYFFDINGIFIWVKRIVLDVNEARSGAQAHGLVGEYRVCSLYVQENHLDDVKALQQEVQS